MTSRVCYLDQYVFIYVGHRGLNNNLNCIQSDMVSVALAPHFNVNKVWNSLTISREGRLPSAITKELLKQIGYTLNPGPQNFKLWGNYYLVFEDVLCLRELFLRKSLSS